MIDDVFFEKNKAFFEVSGVYEKILQCLTIKKTLGRCKLQQTSSHVADDWLVIT